MRTRKEKEENSGWKPVGWPLALFLLACGAFLYLHLFILPCTPIFLPQDHWVFLQDARSILKGMRLYQDFFQFTFPGVQVMFAALIKAFGARIWLPNAVLVALGTLAAWITTLVSRRVLSGESAFLPAFLLVSVEFPAWHFASHHWLSTLAGMTAVLMLLRERTPGLLVTAGALCGLSAWFTQTAGTLLLLGVVVFVLWESGGSSRVWRVIVARWTLPIAGFLPTLLLGIGYFAWRAGPREFLWSTFVFPAKYYRAWVPDNSFSEYWVGVAGMRAWELVPLLIVYATVPWVYLFFLLAYMRGRDAATGKPPEELVLLSLSGFFLFVAVAPVPGWYQLCTVSPPALILLVWLLRTCSISRTALRFLWIVGLLCATTFMVKTVRRERLVRRDLDLPTGRTAFLDTGVFDEVSWLNSRTRPGDFFFGGQNPRFYFPLGLCPPSRVPRVVPNDYTRPADVSDLIEALRTHRVRFLLWQLELDHPPVNAGRGDHLGPLRAYLRAHYHLVKIFSGSYDQVLERND
jgi:hypothetical protein